MSIWAEIFLAWRYLKPKRNAVSVITLISIIGVCLGVCVLMVTIAIMAGFTDEMKAKLLETRGHIQIRNRMGECIKKPSEVIKLVEACGAVGTPLIEGPVLVQKSRKIVAKSLIGMLPDSGSVDNVVARSVKAGKFSLGRGEILTSDIIARELSLNVGDKLLVHSPSKLGKMAKFSDDGSIKKVDTPSEVYLPNEFTVSGIYSVGKYDFDSNILVTGLDDADELFGFPWGAASMVFVKTPDPFHLDGILKKLRKELPDSMWAWSWEEVYSGLLDVLKVEKNMMYFILIFIVLVAAFSIMNTLITVVVQKTREIGLLRALGATPGAVMRIFIMQGFIVGLVGTCVGIALGALVIHWRMPILHFLSWSFHIQIFPKEIYFFNELPATVKLMDIVWIAVSSVVLCTVGGILPAFRAARLDPAQALRYE